LLRTLERETQMSCEVLDTVLDPSPAYDRGRAQYDCRTLLPLLERAAGTPERRALGVADIDLFSPIFTFVLGEAHLGGRSGIFSLHRLDPRFYGLPEDAELLWKRAEREALHETGHLLGLEHCKHPDCVMRFSASAEEVDLKPAEFCPACARLARGTS
jgi:archaemetzincin